MTAPRRPEPDLTLRSRVHTYVAASRARLAAGRELRVIAASDEKVPGGRHGSMLFTALIALGSGLAAVGALWAWQLWSTRSAPPVDDLLPFLVAGPAVGDPPPAEPPPVEPPSVEPSTDGQPVDAGGPTAPTPSPSSQPAVDAVVHVSGAVDRPGVVHLPVGSRVFEAVAAVGGASADADLDRVNLAAPIVDGERIHVPDVGEDQPPALVPSERPDPAGGTGAAGAGPGSGAGPADGAQPLLIDLNRATVAELEELPGVGPATAEAIVRTREARGPFRAVEELLEVTGIGEKRLEVLRPHVWVQAP